MIVRDDLAVWQRLNVCAFLMSGVAAGAGAEAIGEPYEDADGSAYLPLLVQPVVVLEADAAGLQRSRERAERRNVPLAVYTMDMFATAATRTTARSSGRCPAPSSTWWASPCEAAPRRGRGDPRARPPPVTESEQQAFSDQLEHWLRSDSPKTIGALGECSPRRASR